MSFNIFFLCTFFPVLLMTSCPAPCPQDGGNYVQLRGADFDTVYNEVQIFPAGTVINGTPVFFSDINQCVWCLPLDISNDSTIYVLTGNARTDTIRFFYKVALEQTERCGFQAVAVELITESTFDSVFIEPAYLNEAAWDMHINF